MTDDLSVHNSADGSTAEVLYQEVVRLYRAGDIAAMCTAAEQLTDRFASHGKGWHMLGLGRLILGRPEIALAPLAEARRLLPGDVEPVDHLGCAYFMLGRYEEAAEMFSVGVEIDPQRAESWFNAGRNAVARGLFSAAIPALRKAVSLAPEMAFAHDALGLALHELGDQREALTHSQRAVDLLPENPLLRLHLGVAQQAAGDFRSAIQSYQEAIERDNALLPAWCNLAGALHDVGDAAAALRAAEHVLRLAPDVPEVLSVVGTVYAEAGQGELAVQLLDRLTAIRPEFAEGWFNLGNALADPVEKLSALRRALTLQPDFAAAWSNVIFNLNYLPETSAADLLAAAREYGRIVSRQVAAAKVWSNLRDPSRQLRVGFVSADLTEHPVSFFLEGLLMSIDRRQVEALAYFNGAREDVYSERLKPQFAVWRSIWKKSDAEVCQLIAEDRVDILIDLSGHTSGHRLPVFAARPAPLQVSWLGYVGTTGLEAIDYVIADAHAIPEQAPVETVEKVWRLPECYMCFTPPAGELSPGELPAERNGYVTYGCFSNFSKVNDQVLDVWARLLAEQTDARLLLRSRRLGNPDVRERVMARLTGGGVDASRIELAGYFDQRLDALAEYRRVDIALDTFPYCGATTSAEALWMGVPVLTLRGDKFISRIGASLNRNLGLDDWVADSADDYVARAIHLSRDRSRLALLRRTLRDRGAASPLGNPTWFANQFSAALRAMWQQWCRDQGAVPTR